MQGEISQNIYSGKVFTRRDVLKLHSRLLERLRIAFSVDSLDYSQIRLTIPLSWWIEKKVLKLSIHGAIITKSSINLWLTSVKI